jgi:hypothetical protein
MITTQTARVLTKHERIADLRLAKDFLEDFLQDETIDHITFDLADEARVKVLAALDSLNRKEAA